MKSPGFNTEEFCEVLVETDSIVAGASVLSWLEGPSCNPCTDIYVPALKAQALINFVLRSGFECDGKFKCTQTPLSNSIHLQVHEINSGPHNFVFLPGKTSGRFTRDHEFYPREGIVDDPEIKFPERHGVRQRVGFVQSGQDDFMSVQPEVRIDVFVMDIGVSPCRAVADFDFSFLMNYFDGNKFHMWFPNNVLERSGFYNQVKICNVSFATTFEIFFMNWPF